MSENTQITQEVNVSPKKNRARKGHFQVTINNKENLTNTYQLKASDSEEMCTYNFDTDAVTVEAGATAKVALTVSFKKPLFIGAPKVCNFTVTAITSKMEVKTAEGQLECPALLPVWALASGGLAVVAIIAVVIVVANSGDGSAKSPANTSVATVPTTSVTTKPSLTSTTTTPTSATQPSTSFSLTTSVTATTTTTPTTTATPTAPTTTQVVDTPPNLNGVWAFVIKVTEANGVCAGEAGNSSSRQITITQSGRNVTLSGFLGNPANQLTGDITLDAGLWIVKVSGSYPEDGGTTTTSHRLVVKNTSDISGDEDWEWSGPGGTCPGGKASVTATRISSP
jgi:hypothetical protein